MALDNQQSLHCMLCTYYYHTGSKRYRVSLIKVTQQTVYKIEVRNINFWNRCFEIFNIFYEEGIIVRLKLLFYFIIRKPNFNINIKSISIGWWTAYIRKRIIDRSVVNKIKMIVLIKLKIKLHNYQM